MFVLRKVPPYQRAHKYYLLFFMAAHAKHSAEPLAPSVTSVGKCFSVANIFQDPRKRIPHTSQHNTSPLLQSPVKAHTFRSNVFIVL